MAVVPEVRQFLYEVSYLTFSYFLDDFPHKFITLPLKLNGITESIAFVGQAIQVIFEFLRFLGHIEDSYIFGSSSFSDSIKRGRLIFLAHL